MRLMVEFDVEDEERKEQRLGLAGCFAFKRRGVLQTVTLILATSWQSKMSAGTLS
jgi:hypothetical protein